MHEQSKTGDRRTSRTRRALRKALIELIMEKRYDAITVQNVIDRADVGRSTFYAHFRDKEDLFLSDWEALLEGFVQHIEWQSPNGRIVPVRELFSHVQEFHHFYQALVRSRKTTWLFKTGQSYLAKSLEAELTALLADGPQPSVPLPILSNYLASEILTLLKWWLDHNMPYPPARMDEIFHALVMPGFQAVLRDNAPT
jgi:AcrR family transcriptional regulator